MDRLDEIDPAAGDAEHRLAALERDVSIAEESMGARRPEVVGPGEEEAGAASGRGGGRYLGSVKQQMARLRTRLREYGMRPGRARQAQDLRSALDRMAERGDPEATRITIDSINDILDSERLPTRGDTTTVSMGDARVRAAFEEAMAEPGLEGNPEWDAYRELVYDRYKVQDSIEIGRSPRSTDPGNVAGTAEMRARFLAGLRRGEVPDGAARMVRDHLADAVRDAGSETGAVAAGDAVWIDRLSGERLQGPGPNATLWPADPVWDVWRVDHVVELQHGGLEQASNYAAVPQPMHAIKSQAMLEFGRAVAP